MQITIRGYESRDLPLMVAIWNEVVEDGIAFPQEELLTEALLGAENTGRDVQLFMNRMEHDDYRSVILFHIHKQLAD